MDQAHIPQDNTEEHPTLSSTSLDSLSHQTLGASLPSIGTQHKGQETSYNHTLLKDPDSFEHTGLSPSGNSILSEGASPKEEPAWLSAAVKRMSVIGDDFVSDANAAYERGIQGPLDTGETIKSMLGVFNSVKPRDLSEWLSHNNASSSSEDRSKDSLKDLLC